MPASRRLAAATLVVLAAAALLGCAAEAPAPERTPAPIAQPADPPPPSPEELRQARAAEIVDALSTRERVASVIMSTLPGTDAAALGDFVAGNGIGGLILMGGNIPADPAALAGLTAALSPDPTYPTLIAVDEEGGQVVRLPWDGYPGADQLRFAAAEETLAAFAARAELLSSAGINVNFGIVADLGTDPNGFIYWRTLGDTAEEAAPRVAAAVAGEAGSVASALKHFPGHGAAAGDSHFGVPQTPLDPESWAASHALPFASGIDAGAELLMFGHLVYSAVDPLPASLSAEWHRIAREDLGFGGVTVSDDLGMLLDSGLPEYQDLSSNVARALAAGADLALIIRGASLDTLPPLIDAVAASIDAGGPSAERLRDAAIRVAELRLRLGERAAGAGPQTG